MQQPEYLSARGGVAQRLGPAAISAMITLARSG
jgi:hypothetical protein